MIFTCSGGFREAVCKLSGNITRYRALSGRWRTKRAKRGWGGRTFALLRNENKFYKPLKKQTKYGIILFFNQAQKHGERRSCR